MTEIARCSMSTIRWLSWRSCMRNVTSGIARRLTLYRRWSHLVATGIVHIFERIQLSMQSMIETSITFWMRCS